MPSLGRLAPRLRPLVAKPPGSREGTSAWILAAMHGSLYVALSASLVLANKHLVVNTRTPILVASLGSLFGTIVAWTLVGCGRVELKTRLTRLQWVTYVLPTGVFAAVALAFANLALTYVRLSLAQMAKAFAPAVTAAALVTLRLDRAFDDKCARAVCVIVGGCVVAAWGATSAGNEPRAWIGLGFMVACEVAEALRLCGVQYLLSSSSNRNDDATAGNNDDNAGFDPATSNNRGSNQPTNQGMTLFDGLFYFSPVSLACLWLLVYLFEWDALDAELHGRAALGNPFSLLATGCFGFLANVAGLGVVQHGGAVTLTTLSLLKNGVVIALAVVAYGDPVTVRAVAGYTVATYGFVMYQEARAKAAAGGGSRRDRNRRRRRRSSRGGGRFGRRQRGDPGGGRRPDRGWRRPRGRGDERRRRRRRGRFDERVELGQEFAADVERTRGEHGVGSAKVEDGTAGGGEGDGVVKGGSRRR